MKHSWILIGATITIGVVAQGCSGSGELRDPLATPDTPLVASPNPPHPEASLLDASAALQLTLAAESAVLRTEFEALQRDGGWGARGYFDAQEQAAIAGLLFRFVVNHSSFWNELDRRGGPELAGIDEQGALRAHLLALHAGLALADSSSFLVAKFIDDPLAVEKLNESFYRYEISAGSYERLRLSITSRQREELWDAAWQLHEQQLSDPAAGLTALAAQNPAFATLLEALEGLHDQAIAQLRVLRDHEARGPGDVDKTLRHTRAAELGRDSARELGDASYAMRSLVFKDVSRIKSPTAHLIRFSSEQKQKIHGLLRPGDILLTYTAGYISDVFIPGNFKHGIT
jgi:hypothetical protein